MLHSLIWVSEAYSVYSLNNEPDDPGFVSWQESLVIFKKVQNGSGADAIPFSGGSTDVHLAPG